MSSSGESLDRLADSIGGTLHGVEGSAASEIRIVDVTHDSRRAGAGVLFVAIPGFTTDGHDFVPSAVDAGAPAVVVERLLSTSVPQMLVDDARSVLGPLASRVHGYPASKLRTAGITGTNGKTSVTWLIESIAQATDRVGVIGTLGVHMAGRTMPAERTTPEADDLQRLLVQMVRSEISIVAMEVSSHALALCRVDGIHFDVVAFTNLSQDHLDFHEDMEDYFTTKARLFERDRSRQAVVWVDDEMGRRLAESCEIPLTTVGTTAADVIIDIGHVGLSGSRFSIVGEGMDITIALPILGDFMVANAALAAVVCRRLGFDSRTIASGLERAQPIPGRFEHVSVPLDASVVVDYSHTPAGVEAAIESARRLTDGSIIAVLGAGGDRDRAKRPLMGRAASRADWVIVTSDNPRSEDPDAIMADVTAGVTAKHDALRDRRAAIRRGLDLARAGDVVLIMGKGHEQYQEIGGRRIPFDDRVVAVEEASRS